MAFLSVSPWLDPSQWTSQEWDDVREWLIAIGTVGATIAAVAFGLGLRDWVFRPSLELSSDDDDPSCRLVFPFTDGQIGGYVRILVRNTGRATARGVNVRIASVERWDGAEWTRERAELDAREMAWANTPQGAKVDIPAHSSRPLDLAALVQTGNGGALVRLEIALGSVGHPSSGANFFPDAGSWRLELLVDGDNVHVMRRYIGFGFSAEWWDPNSGRLWTHSLRITPPTKKPVTKPTIVPTTATLLVDAAEADAASTDV